MGRGEDSLLGEEEEEEDNREMQQEDRGTTVAYLWRYGTDLNSGKGTGKWYS